MRIKLKKVRTKCMVKGCRNSGNKVATYNVSASHEFGKGVIMCAECIKGATEALMVIHNEGQTPHQSPAVTASPQGEAKVEEAEGKQLEEAVVVTTEEPSEEQEAIDKAPEKPKKKRSTKTKGKAD